MRALTLAVVLCALVAAGCGGGMGEDAALPAETPMGKAASNRPPAPAIEGTSLEGERISLADYRGRPVFVNVWSSW